MNHLPRATNLPLTKFGVRVFGPKKSPLHKGHHVLATTGQRCANKKRFWAKRKNGRFSVIPGVAKNRGEPWKMTRISETEN